MCVVGAGNADTSAGGGAGEAEEAAARGRGDLGGGARARPPRRGPGAQSLRAARSDHKLAPACAKSCVHGVQCFSIILHEDVIRAACAEEQSRS